MVESQIALQAPVKCWIHKKANHCAATWIIGVIFVIYSLFLVHIVSKLVSQLNLDVENLLELPSKLGFEGLKGLIIIVAISLIFPKIPFRLFASQLHLWNDASERVTMMKTYLALAIKGHAKEAHMEVLIQRLFKPASDGVVKDDFGEISGLETLLKR